MMAAVMAAPVAALRAWAEAAARGEAAARAALVAATPLLGSLAALAAQMRAARRLPWDATALGAFPELRARLWRKQRGAAEALLEQLGERREELRAVRDAVGAAGSAVLRLVEERGPAELGLAVVLRRGPRCPSLADVLEGLQDVERYYRHLYPFSWGCQGGAGGAGLSLLSLAGAKVLGEQTAPTAPQLGQPGRRGSPTAVLGEDFGALQRGRCRSRYTPEGLTVCGEPSRGELLTWLLTGSRDWHCPTSGTFCDAAEGMRS